MYNEDFFNLLIITKFGVSFSEIYTFIQQGCIKLLIIDRTCNFWCSFELYIHQRILKKSISFHKNMKQLKCFQHLL